MPADTTGKTLQVLDLMLEFFADDNYWARGPLSWSWWPPLPCRRGPLFQCEAWASTCAGNLPSRSGIAPTADRANRFQWSYLPQRGWIAL